MIHPSIHPLVWSSPLDPWRRRKRVRGSKHPWGPIVLVLAVGGKKNIYHSTSSKNRDRSWSIIYINCRCSLLHAHLLSVCKYWINDTCILFHLPVVVGHGPMLMRDWCIWSWWRLVCFTFLLYVTCSKLHACFNASYAKLNTLELFNLQGMRGSTEWCLHVQICDRCIYSYSNLYVIYFQYGGIKNGVTSICC